MDELIKVMLLERYQKLSTLNSHKTNERNLKLDKQIVPKQSRLYLDLRTKTPYLNKSLLRQVKGRRVSVSGLARCPTFTDSNKLLKGSVTLLSFTFKTKCHFSIPPKNKFSHTKGKSQTPGHIPQDAVLYKFSTFKWNVSFFVNIYIKVRYQNTARVTSQGP